MDREKKASDTGSRIRVRSPTTQKRWTTELFLIALKEEDQVLTESWIREGPKMPYREQRKNPLSEMY